MSSAHGRYIGNRPGYRVPPPAQPAHRAGRQHVAGQVRLVQRRPLRLIMTACAAAAVLCLVTGLVGVAAGTTAGTLQQAAGTGLTRGPGVSGTSDTPAGRTGALAGWHASKSERTRPFVIGAAGAWGMAWSFRCGSGTGRFAVTQVRAGPRGASVAAAGRSGQGTDWIADDPGRHVLDIVSGCSWTIRVIAR